MNKRLRTAAVLTCMMLVSCSPADDPFAPIAHHPVQVLELERQDSYVVTRTYTGTVTARQHDDVGFEQNGSIEAIHVREGDAVRAGDLLAELDTQLLAIQQSEIVAQIAELEARKQLNTSSLARQQSLQKSGFSAEQRLDELRSEQDMLAASGQRLRASLETIDVRLDKSRLRAPFDAVVSRRYRDNGAVVGAGTAVLRIIERGDFEAAIGVPARLVDTLEPAQARQLRAAGREFDAVVEAIGADIDPVTRTVSIRIRLPAQAGLIEGELIALPLEERIARSGAWLPASAVTDGMRGLWLIYALQAADEGLWQIEARDVELLHEAAGRVFVDGAFADGEWVVAGALHRYAPGQVVSRTPAETP